ncbi:MAG: cupin domain-containing protein [Gammaproteobacteria bacterium]|nr:cupin domain-containing protein [Gammaproteobacteria bacterium]
MRVVGPDRHEVMRGALRGVAVTLLGLVTVIPAAAGADAPPAVGRARFSLAKAGETFTRPGEIREIKLTAIDSGGRFTIVDGYLSAGMQLPAHFHQWHSETFYVLEGQEEWTVDGETHRLGPGSLVYIPPGAIHSVRVIGERDSHHLLISEPGGHEYSIRRQQQQTAGERADPDAQRKLMELNDFHLAPARKPAGSVQDGPGAVTR